MYIFLHPRQSPTLPWEPLRVPDLVARLLFCDPTSFVSLFVPAFSVPYIDIPVSKLMHPGTC